MPAPPSTALAEPSPLQGDWLVVDRLATAPPDFDELLSEIEKGFGLDPYSAKQRLLGRGYHLLLRGRRDILTPLRELLAAHGFPACLLGPALIKIPLAKLQGLRRSSAAMTLLADNGELTIDGDIHVVAVLADLSGAAVANGIKHLLVRHAYQGGAAALRPHDDEHFCRTVIKGEPVLDLYLLHRQDGIQGAVRVLPGRYDPSGFGEEKTVSAGLNLLTLLDFARSRAGRLTLRTDFGLANLPGCQLLSPGSAAAHDRNLAALSRFGSLAAQFSAQCGAGEGEKDSARYGTPTPLPLKVPQEPAAAILTPPPERAGVPVRRWLRSPGDALLVACVLLGLAVAVLGRGQIPSWIWKNGIGSGAVPGFLALILFWRAFAAVHLRRMIENTPVSRIRSLATGMVEVCGQAERCYALVTPVTGLPCVYYSLRRYRRKERGGSWELISEQSSGLHPFWLRDATGRVKVDPAAADLRPGCRQEGSGDGAGGGFMGRATAPDNDEKWVEESIPEGETIYVLGFAAPRHRNEESLHAATVARLRVLKGSRELRERFDSNGDGKIDADEWDEARRVTAGEVAKSHLAGRQQRRRQEEDLTIGAPPRSSYPFLIAQSLSEGALARTLWWRALALFLLGLLLIFLALRQLLTYLPVSGY